MDPFLKSHFSFKGSFQYLYIWYYLNSYDLLFTLLKQECAFPVCHHMYNLIYKMKLDSHISVVFYLTGRFEFRRLLFQIWMLCLCQRCSIFGRVMPADFQLYLGHEETLDVDEAYPAFVQNFQARSARLNCSVLDTDLSGSCSQSENYSDVVVFFCKYVSKDMDIVC